MSYNLKSKKYKLNIILIASLTNLGAGGKFLHSLLDDHPEVLTIPNAIQQFCDVKNFDKKNKKDIIKQLDKFKEFFDSKYDVTKGRADLGPNKNLTIKISKKIFFNYLDNFLKENKWSLKNYILSVYFSYQFALNKSIKKKYIVIYLHDMFYLEIINRLFNKSKILTTVRLPINSFATYTRNKKIKAERTKNIIQGDYLHWLYSVFKFQDFKEKIYCINIEELHKNPKQSLISMCKKINLKFDNSLLSSTFNGKIWYNPRKYVYTGFKFQNHNKVNYAEVEKDVCHLIDSSTKNFQTFLGYMRKNDLKIKINTKFPVKSFINYFFYLIKFFIFRSNKKNIYSMYDLIRLKYNEFKNFNKKIGDIKKYDRNTNFEKKLILVNKNSHVFKRN
tara:strand:+ start:103 stop:1272 length:1170 start_codon:yes stop_codon:yes gene_type:complete